MTEPQIVVLHDSITPFYLVVRPDDDEANTWHLLEWCATLGDAQEIVRDWHIGRDRSGEARRQRARDAAESAFS